MSLSYGWEKFHSAIHSLAGSGSQRQRLVDAYISNIILVEPENIPSEIIDEFEQFRRGMTSVQPKGQEGSVQATVDSMDDLTVSDMVKRIISMYDTIARHQKPFGSGYGIS